MKQLAEYVKNIDSHDLLEVIYDYEGFRQGHPLKDKTLLKLINDFQRNYNYLIDDQGLGPHYWFQELYIAAMRETINRSNEVIKKLEKKVFSPCPCSSEKTLDKAGHTL